MKNPMRFEKEILYDTNPFLSIYRILFKGYHRDQYDSLKDTLEC